MSIRIEVKRSAFFKELQEEKQMQFFDQKEKKFLPCIDNIYYTVNLEDDYNGNNKLKEFLSKLELLKTASVGMREPQQYELYDLHCEVKSYDIYTFCLSKPDLYDIFITKYLPNQTTPRAVVQIRAFGLWTQGDEKLIEESYKDIAQIFGDYGCKISHCRENRIDYCYHTNAIQNLTKISTDEYLSKHMHTTMQRIYEISSITSDSKGTSKSKEYISLGNLKSNNVAIRIYNKAKEVIDVGKKGFFFDIWYNEGLINYYDKYCLEYAYTGKSYDLIDKAKLEFYLLHGTDEELKDDFKKALKSNKTTYADINAIAKAMPALTTVINIEYMTKRKFYYYSDAWIDEYLTTDTKRFVPSALERLYKITDNRSVFLKYLTSTTLSFKKDDKYLPWWERLRNTKLKGLNLNLKLVREYSHDLDEQQAKKRLINALGTVALYSDKIYTTFEADASDVLAHVNDNDKMLTDWYVTKKVKKQERIKNRKIKRAETLENVSTRDNDSVS